MTNFRQLPKNNLIRNIKKIRKAVIKKCRSCIGDQKNIGCSTSGCSLFPYCPYLGKKINKTNYQKE
ncbi:MAG: hypothetical protein V1922_00995, partial [bacterium]